MQIPGGARGGWSWQKLITALGTRGLTAAKLEKSDLWWHGPEWLRGRKEDWPERQEIEETPESTKELKKAVVSTVKVSYAVSIENVTDVCRYSSKEKLVRVTAFVLRFAQNCKARIRREGRVTGGLTVEEILSAERSWVQTVQAGLKERTSFSQLVNQLGLVEIEGVLYCKGRLGASDLLLEARHPILLDNKHHYTSLLIEQCHQKVHHSGVRATLAEIRSMYWIPKGRKTVKRVVSKCTVCKKLEDKAFSAPPGTDLLSFRVKEATPFSTVGVDFASPLFIRKEGKQMEKVYIVLYTCSATRAVHVDLVEDMSAPVFLRSFRKFVARRGTPALVVSDNAKTFKASAKFFRKLYSDPQVRSYFDTSRIRWRFNLDRSPWWGGFFERLAGSVKRPFRKVLENARLNFHELLTVLLEIESTLNSCPLTYEYDEIEGEMLTPSHLIFRFRLSSLPDVIPSEEEECVPSETKDFIT